MGAIALRPPGAVRAVIFDLDEALLVRAPAWRYTVEEAIASATGRRVDAAPLVDEYRRRPWRHALRVLLQSPGEVERCASLCETMFARSAMKRLLVHEGLGMALDRLRGQRIEIGAISREPHALALRQIESTGLDRFLAVLSPTPAGQPWDAAARIGECLGYLGREPRTVTFVSGMSADLRGAGETGVAVLAAGWADDGALPHGIGILATPAELESLTAG